MISNRLAKLVSSPDRFRPCTFGTSRPSGHPKDEQDQGVVVEGGDGEPDPLTPALRSRSWGGGGTGAGNPPPRLVQATAAVISRSDSGW